MSLTAQNHAFLQFVQSGCSPEGEKRVTMISQTMSGKTILFLVTEDWYFWSHRLPVARAARDAGAKVVVVCRVNKHADQIRAEGFELWDAPIDRTGINPLKDITTLWFLWNTYRAVRPDLIHHVATKPVLYGSLIAWLTGVPAILNAMAGLGYLFISQGMKARLLRGIFQKLLVTLCNRKNTALVVQNRDDQQTFLSQGVRAEQIVVIRGSGVDLDRYHATDEPDGTPVALCVSRMLWDKGIGELVEAARRLKEKNVPIKVRLVGGTDINPSSIPQEQLDLWHEEGVIDFAGHSNDVVGEYARAHIAVLPSYREGLPKSLLEAASCKRPIVSTDVPGCREICVDGESGILVPVKTSRELADALETLALDKDLRVKMGAKARQLAEDEFATPHIVRQTTQVYSDLLK